MVNLDWSLVLDRMKAMQNQTHLRQGAPAPLAPLYVGLEACPPTSPHPKINYYDVSKESPAGGLCGGLCGRVVQEVVRGTLGGCAGRLGVFLVGCALRPVHSFFACF